MSNDLKETKNRPKDNTLFYLALFFLPFENFFFAPSAGWAAITPLILVLYLLINFKKIGLMLSIKKIALLLSITVLITIINIPLVGIEPKNTINSYISLLLGFVSFLSMNIFYIKNKHGMEAEKKKIAQIITISYVIVIAIGILQYFSTKYGISIIKNVYAALAKRNYLAFGRVQFFYTEPSFIGMHIFGILLPIYILTKNKKIMAVLLLHLVVAIVASSSIRFFIDVIVVCVIFLYYYLSKYKLYLLMIVIPALIAGMVLIVSSQNYRFNYIVKNGVYSDGSLASRYFRINASIKGYKKDPSHMLIGWGVGNEIVPLREGYIEAKREYRSSYKHEVKELGDEGFTNESVSYSLPIRLVSEYGLIISLLLLAKLIQITKKSKIPEKWPLLLTILYAYIQFESLAFYSLWLLLAILLNTRRDEG